MIKLKLSNINKNYYVGDQTVLAVKNVSLNFRKNEFVAILGPSGCGKTTLLNVIGGLDQYDNGDLIINGMSTKSFSSSDWDAYRNRSIGFVFQNYNLISHQTVLRNVEISLTLSGTSRSERHKRAMAALESVGILDQMKKKPNQLSGGQMQRVAIARALVNNPDIILADEPTGALDSEISVQVMEILKEISKSKLVIMVTHNKEIADQYASRIIQMLDGEILSDSNPIKEHENVILGAGRRRKTKGIKKTSMNIFTALNLSFRNLVSKKWRTLVTSFAGSIGIIGVALVLALSSGLGAYLNTMQSETLASFPITISKNVQNVMMGPTDDNHLGMLENTESEEGKFTEENIVVNYDTSDLLIEHRNVFSDEYLEYIEQMPEEMPDAVNSISFMNGITMNLLAKADEQVVLYAGPKNAGDSPDVGDAMGMSASSFWYELPDNEEFILSIYELIGEGSRMPDNKQELLLVVDEYNRIDSSFFEKLGYSTSEDFQLTDFIGKQFLKVVPNDSYYEKKGDIYVPITTDRYEEYYNDSDSLPLTITGVLRLKEESAGGNLQTGLAYTKALAEHISESAQTSEITTEQIDSDRNLITGIKFEDENAKNEQLIRLGADSSPVSISIFPKDFDSKDKIKEYLDAYNVDRETEEQIAYSDLGEIISSMTGTFINTVSYVLIGFAAISLLVSTIMIAIITYVSVIERTKEIGVLRAVGARKKDISRVFNAETLIIGFVAGLFGVSLAYVLSIPINNLVIDLVGIDNIAALNPLHALILLAGSMLLTLIAGFIPSRIAAGKNPVEALRVD